MSVLLETNVSEPPLQFGRYFFIAKGTRMRGLRSKYKRPASTSRSSSKHFPSRRPSAQLRADSVDASQRDVSSVVPRRRKIRAQNASEYQIEAPQAHCGTGAGLAGGRVYFDLRCAGADDLQSMCLLERLGDQAGGRTRMRRKRAA